MRDTTKEWFATINPDVCTYIAYFNDQETSRAFQNFKADDSDLLESLFCIDMLNEGAM